MNKPQAFTLIETLLALFVLVSSVYVLSDLHIRAMTRVITNREYIERIFLLKESAYRAYFDTKQESKKNTKTTVEEPAMKIEKTIVELTKNSEVKDLEKRLTVFSFTASWQGVSAARTLTLNTIGFLAPEPEKKEKK